MTIYLIEELWHDSLENEYSDATGYKVIGYVTNEQAAKRICEPAGISTRSGWPNTAGQPNRRWKAIANLECSKCGHEGCDGSPSDFYEHCGNCKRCS